VREGLFEMIVVTEGEAPAPVARAIPLV